MIYLIAHTKGGVAKTTLTLNLGVMRARAGRTVALYDVDTGQSLKSWAAVRAELHPGLTQLPVAAKFGPTAHLEILDEAEHFDDVLIDAGGEGIARPEIELLLTVADVLVTPCGCSTADSRRLANIHKLLTTARRYNKKLRALLVPTKASTNVFAKDLIEFYSDVVEFDQYAPSTNVISQRAALGRWATTGLAVCEADPVDDKALGELRALYEEVFA